MNKLLPIVANDVNMLSPIIYCLGILSFEVSIEVPKFLQCFTVEISLIDTIKNDSTDFANARIHGS